MALWHTLGRHKDPLSRSETVMHVRRHVEKEARALWSLPRRMVNVLDKVENIPFLGEAITLIPGESELHRATHFLVDAQDKLSEEVGSYTKQHMKSLYGNNDPGYENVVHVADVTAKRGKYGGVETRDTFPLEHKPTAADINFMRPQHSLSDAQPALNQANESGREYVYGAAGYPSAVL